MGWAPTGFRQDVLLPQKVLKALICSTTGYSWNIRFLRHLSALLTTAHQALYVDRDQEVNRLAWALVCKVIHCPFSTMTNTAPYFGRSRIRAYGNVFNVVRRPNVDSCLTSLKKDLGIFSCTLLIFVCLSPVVAKDSDYILHSLPVVLFNSFLGCHIALYFVFAQSDN